MKILENSTYKVCKSKYYNFVFNKETGEFARWGEKKEDDPDMSPIGPEILDLEISSGGDCSGRCPWCSPEGTMVNTPNGEIPIEKLNKGDLVIGYDISSKSIKINEIEEVYNRDYEGEIVCLELSNGKTLKLTPEHRIILNDGREVKSKDLNEKDLEKIIFF